MSRKLLPVFFLPEKLLKYVVRGPIADGRTNYEPVKSRFAGELAFLFDVSTSGVRRRVNATSRIIRDFTCKGMVTFVNR